MLCLYYMDQIAPVTKATMDVYTCYPHFNLVFSYFYIFSTQNKAIYDQF